MIRRGFWLTAGAMAGIYGYRRVSAVGRRLSASFNPGASRTPPASLAADGPSRTRRGTVGLAREAFRFTRDVREGMELYMARHSAPEGPSLGARDREPPRDVAPAPDVRINHDPQPTEHDSQPTDHDPQPKDGH